MGLCEPLCKQMLVYNNGQRGAREFMKDLCLNWSVRFLFLKGREWNDCVAETALFQGAFFFSGCIVTFIIAGRVW